jgi:hypothetical protein
MWTTILIALGIIILCYAIMLIDAKPYPREYEEMEKKEFMKKMEEHKKTQK